MKIELRRITYSAALSRDTNAYTADIYIDGELAFHGRNDGNGGADFFDKVGRWTEMEVDDWLKANRPPFVLGEHRLDHDLEMEVSALLSRDVERRRLKRLMRTNLLTIERGQLLRYPLRKRPIETIIGAVRTDNPDAVVVNGAGDDVLNQALDVFFASR